MIDAAGYYHWSSSAFNLAVGRPCVSGHHVTEFGSRNWAQERIDATRELIERRASTRFIEIFDGRFVESIGVPAEIHADQWNLLVFVVGKGTHRPEAVNALPLRALVCGHWGPLDVLTRRQLEVLRLIAQGRSNPEIAEALGHTRRAIEWHVHELLRITGARDRIALHKLGFEAGFLHVEDSIWPQFVLAHRARRPGTSVPIDHEEGEMDGAEADGQPDPLAPHLNPDEIKIPPNFTSPPTSSMPSK